MNRNSDNEGHRLTDPGRESSGNGNRSRGSKVGSMKENEMVSIKEDLKINTSINRETDIKEPLMEKTEVRIFLCNILLFNFSVRLLPLRISVVGTISNEDLVSLSQKK
jgi:hypothetical protein